MNFSLTKLRAYCESMSSQVDPLLVSLDRETHLKTIAPQMQSGPFQGLLLYFITQMHRPKVILEIGTFTAYSTICFAKGLHPDAELHSMEANKELRYIIEKYVAQLENKAQIHLHFGDAKQMIPNLDKKLDLVFIDAGKRDNSLYFDLVFDMLNPGGIILVDNVLWSGKVTMESHDNDTRMIHDFNTKIKQDDRVEKIMLPIRDGLLIIRKK